MAFKKANFIFVSLLLIGLLSIAFSFATDLSPCIFYNLWGVPCPSCGMTRAYTALFSGNFLLALWSHPLFWIVPLTPFLFIGKSLNDGKFNKKKLIKSLIILFVLVWIIRLILLFPTKPPMTFNENALIPKLFENLF